MKYFDKALAIGGLLAFITILVAIALDAHH